VGSIIQSNANSSTAFYYFFYDWEVATYNTCISDRVEAVVSISVGVDEIDQNGIRIWPNPTDGIVNVKLDGVNGSVNVEVLDLAGRTVLTRSFSRSGSEGVLDLSSLATGEYVLRVFNKEELLVRPISLKR
jgi:hypothetical protein